MKIKAKEKTGTGMMVLMVVAVFFAVAVVPTMVVASPSSGGWQFKEMVRQKHRRPLLGFWQDQKVVQMLELTKAQIQQIRDADFTAREKHLALKAQIDQLRLKMDRAFSHEVVDSKAIRQLAQKEADLNGKMFVQKIETRLGLNTILSPDQIQKLKQHGMDQKRKGKRCGKRPVAERHLADKMID